MSCPCNSQSQNIDLLHCTFDKSLVKKTLSEIYDKIKSGCLDDQINAITNSYKYYKQHDIKSIMRCIYINQEMSESNYDKLINEQNNTNNTPLTNNDYITNMNICEKDDNCCKKKCITVRYIIRDIYFQITTYEKIKECDYIDFRTFMIDLTRFVLILYYKTITKNYSLLSQNIYRHSFIINDTYKNMLINDRRLNTTITFPTNIVIVEK